MAKIVIAGDAVVVTSAMKLEDIKTIEKYRPKELVLKGGEDGKEPIFGVGTTHCAGSINAVGASFGSETRDDDKLACITLFLDGVTGDVKDWVADRLGAAIINLNKLEEKLPAVLDGRVHLPCPGDQGRRRGIALIGPGEGVSGH